MILKHAVSNLLWHILASVQCCIGGATLCAIPAPAVPAACILLHQAQPGRLQMFSGSLHSVQRQPADSHAEWGAVQLAGCAELSALLSSLSALLETRCMGALRKVQAGGSCTKWKRAACSNHAVAAVCSHAGLSSRQVRQMNRKGCHLTPRRLTTTAAVGLPLIGRNPAGCGVQRTRSGILRGEARACPGKRCTWTEELSKTWLS